MRKSIILILMLFTLGASAEENESNKTPIAILWLKSTLNYTDFNPIKNKLPTYNSPTNLGVGIFGSVGLEFFFAPKASIEGFYQYDRAENSKNHSSTAVSNNTFGINYRYTVFHTKNCTLRPSIGIGARHLSLQAYIQDADNVINFDDYLNMKSSSIQLNHSSLGALLGISINSFFDLNNIKENLLLYYAIRLGTYIPLVDMGWKTPTIEHKLENTPNFSNPSFMLSFDLGIPLISRSTKSGEAEAKN